MTPLTEPTASLPAEEEAPAGDAPEEVAKQWLASIDAASKIYEKWTKRAERITRRYRADAEQTAYSEAAAKYNLFWSNVQTLAPATYSRRPKVDVSRRFRDNDPVGRLAGMILERALQYEVDCGLEFHHVLEACTIDRLLGGQAVTWVRYEPSFAFETQTNPETLAEEQIEVLSGEKAPVDYVYWKDFLISPARTWADARWVARRVMFSKEALRKRFAESCEALGGDIELVPCNYDPAQVDPDRRDAQGNAIAASGTDDTMRRALVWEIWNKEKKELIWVCQGFEFPLDIKDDPANLEDFWPCPRPLWATMTPDTLVPVPDYVLYVTQLRELDVITNRISLLLGALRVVGVYDSAQSALQTLLTSGRENQMVPVNSWAAFAEKGGLKGTMDFVPIEMVVTVLEGLYKAREAIKQTVYEITGMADIVRGSSVASETLGAQQIKAKFANLRLSSRQQQVAEFVTQILQIKAQIMCNQYSPETLVKISSAEQITEVQQPGGPERLQAALALLKNQSTRQYRIEVASQSMIELDEVDERERRNEFMSSVSNFMLAMKNIAAVSEPMIPVALEMLKFVVRGFSVGRSLEASIDDAADQIKKQMAAPKPPPPPSPEQVKLQIADAAVKSDEKIAAAEIASAERLQQMKAELDITLERMQGQMDAMREERARMDSAISAEADHERSMEGAREQDRRNVEMAPPEASSSPDIGPDIAMALQPLVEAQIEGQKTTVELFAQMMATLSKPRINKAVRGADGAITHSVSQLEDTP